MNCQACSRRTLSLFFRSFIDGESIAFSSTRRVRNTPSPRFFSVARRLQSNTAFAHNANPFDTEKPPGRNDALGTKKERPAWLVEKEATKRKLNGEAWNPRKKLSPDTMEGIRHLHQTQPERFTTPVLANHFKVSPDVIRRILKSKWRPTDAEQEDRLRRWDKRGEQIWTHLVELGVKPPKKWREMGVGRAKNGEKPRWKSGARNTVDVKDSFEDDKSWGWDAAEDLIPIVDGTSTTQSSRKKNMSFSDRMGV